MTVSDTEIKKKIKDIISRLYFIDSDDIVDDITFSEQGFLDSKNILQLIVVIQSNFALEIDKNNVEFDNFESVEKIASFINRNAKEQ